jgi:hypothetical protein
MLREEWRMCVYDASLSLELTHQASPPPQEHTNEQVRRYPQRPSPRGLHSVGATFALRAAALERLGDWGAASNDYSAALKVGLQVRRLKSHTPLVTDETILFFFFFLPLFFSVSRSI